MKIFLFCIKILLLFPLHNISSLDFDNFGKSIEIYLRREKNEVFDLSADFLLIGGIKFNNSFLLRGGTSIGKKADDLDLKLFTTAGVPLFKGKPLYFSLSWIYNDFYAYNVHSNSILPGISYNAKRIGTFIGMNFRFTSFFDESAISESLLSYSVYYKLLNGKNLLISFIWGNFDEFYARNVGAYSFDVLVSVRINSNWKIINEIEIYQIGGTGFTGNYYGFAWKGGVKFSW